MASEDSTNNDLIARGGAGGESAVTKLSPWSVADTVARLSAVVAARGLDVYAVLDHGGRARDIGVALRDTQVVIIGSPSAMATLIAAAPLTALDLPLRVLVWDDGHRTFVSYPSPAAVARRYGLAGDLGAAFAGIDALIDTVIDR